MITDKRKCFLLSQSQLCIVYDSNQWDGFNIFRPPITTDEEWDWISNGYHNMKKECRRQLRLKKLKRILTNE